MQINPLRVNITFRATSTSSSSHSHDTLASSADDDDRDMIDVLGVDDDARGCV
jgi:hypothetical protein